MIISRLLLPVLLISSASGSSVQVSGDSNIFSSGHDSVLELGGGSLPPEIILPSGVGRYIYFPSVIGQTHNAGGTPQWSPDGFGFDVDIFAAGVISGSYTDRAMSLLGVFLTNDEPGDSAPETIDFTSTGIGPRFLTLAPDIAQSFLIGNGTTGGQIQQFFIPDSATRLFLGFADAGGFQGNPSTFSDNTGFLSAEFEVFGEPVPEPAGPLLIVLSASILGLSRRRRLL